jgi:hypothetical protein
MTVFWGRASGGPLAGQTIAHKDKVHYVNVAENDPAPIKAYLSEIARDTVKYEVGSYTFDEDRKLWDWRLQ